MKNCFSVLTAFLSLTVCWVFPTSTLCAQTRNHYGYWRSLMGPDTNRVTGLKFADGVLFASTYGGGVFLNRTYFSQVTVEPWLSLNSGLPDVSVRALYHISEGEYSDKNTIIVATDMAVFVTNYAITKPVINWRQVGKGVFNGGILCFMLGSDGRVYAGGTGGVYVSMDKGMTWQSYSKGLPNDTVTAMTSYSDNTIYAGFASSGIYVLPPADSVWRISHRGTVGHRIQSMTISIAQNHQGVFATTSDSVYYQQGGNPTWTSLPNSDLVSANNQCIIEDLIHTWEREMCMGTFGGGVFIADASTTHWSPLNDSLTDLRVTALVASPCIVSATKSGARQQRSPANCGFALGTEDKGVFEYSRYSGGLGVNALYDPATLNLRIDPNPVSHQLHLVFTLPEASRVSVTVIDQQGNAVTTVSSADYRERGEQHISVPAESLPSGVYHVRLRAGVLESIGQVVVVR